MKNDIPEMVLNFTGRVAIITGAARGLGREYALLLASRGASVVVNDLGGSRDGTGKSSAADQVVQEIIKLGGKAVADYNSVEDGEKIVRTALDHFGRIDILINNAGILRDKSMMKMTIEDFDLVHRVHLRGSFLVTKAAWPYFRQQNYGRIIMTASPSGIYGNFGQANYSSAKLGLLALAKTLAVEGEKYNIKCNTIVPVAASRLTEDLLPEDMLSLFQPSYVAPIVVFLCHETCPVNGEIFEAAGGYYGRYQWNRSRGKVFRRPHAIKLEDIRDFWSEITDMTGADCPASIQHHTVKLTDQLQHGNDDEKSSEIQVQRSTTEPQEVSFVLTPNEAILYALSIGVSTEEVLHLKYLYENSDEFDIFPTWATTISLNAIYETALLSEAVDRFGLQDNLIQTLHGEQYLKIYRKIPVPGKLWCQPKIIDVLDKGSGALIICEVPAYDSDRNLIFYNQLSFFMIGSGNFGGKRQPESDANLVNCVDPPKRDPDYVTCQRTSLEQAALFRLCGDKNPLHIDSNVSVISGFKKPILHGLCMLGYAVRHILSRYARYDGKYFDAVKARFVGSIVPGQTIETRTWLSSTTDVLEDSSLVRIHFECYVKETGAKLISSAFVDLKTPLPEPETQMATSIEYHIPESVSSSQNDEQKCLVDEIFEGKLKEKVRSHPEVVKKINTVYQFIITKNGQQHTMWTLDLKNGNGNVYRGKASNPDCILTADDEVLANIFLEKDDPLEAYLSGRLKIAGNVMAAQKLHQLGEADSAQKQKYQEDEDDRKLLESIPISGVKSDLIFTILRNRMHEEPELIRRITAAYQFNITLKGRHATTWSMENRTNPTGAVYNQPYKKGKPDCLVTVEDDDLVKLMFGKLNPQRAFMLGKLKVKGNIMLLQRLHTIWFDLQKSGKAPEIPYIVDLISKTDLMPGLKSEMMVIELIQRLVRLPYLCKEVKTLIGFEIIKDGKISAEYVLDFTKNQQSGVFDRGLPEGDQYCILTMSDDDFVRLCYHRFTLEQGIEMGKIKVRGDRNVIGKISIIFKTPTSRVKL